MTPIQTTYEQMMSKFDEKFKCIQKDCDGNGCIPVQVSEDDWEADQCQFHAEYIFPIKSHITQSLISLLTSEIERMEGSRKYISSWHQAYEGKDTFDCVKGYNQAVDDSISNLRSTIDYLQTRV